MVFIKTPGREARGGLYTHLHLITTALLRGCFDGQNRLTVASIQKDLQ